MDASEFVAKWRKASLQNEMQVYADHLDDLCRLANHPTRLQYDTTGERFAVQKSVTKLGGTTGAADAWFQGRFAIEYKGKGGDLDAAYRQLLEYRDNLENPPLLIVCDLDRIVIRTNYTGRTTRKIELSLDNLASGEKISDTELTAVEILWKVFHRPLELIPEETTAKLTEKVAERFKFVADALKNSYSHESYWDPETQTRKYRRNYEDMAIAKFLNRLVFCMFASDVGLLPPNIVGTIIENSRSTARATAEQFAALFRAMAEGGAFGPFQVRHFNGGLFADAEVIEVDSLGLAEILAADRENWADVEPSIFGTLFERVIDEKQRKALGKHYTSREDIELLIHPVIMWPLLREWGGEDAIDQPLDAPPTGGIRREVEDSMHNNRFDVRGQAECHAKLQAFVDRLGRATVLDPACGSGNFLYVALEKLIALEHEAVKLGLAWELPRIERRVHPRQLFGIEKNEYAHQLASTVVWIGYLQAKRKRGDYEVDDPVLEPLNNIENKDAILDVSDPANPNEPEWPAAEFIVGNPPFLGDKKMRGELGNEYVDAVRRLYAGRVGAGADFCCYWHERARSCVHDGATQRAGLLATQAIRNPKNRGTIRRIAASGALFFAVPNKRWPIDGDANVRVALIGFDDGTEARRELNGVPVEGITTDLQSALDLDSATQLAENVGASFIGTQKSGPFEMQSSTAMSLLAMPNPNGRSSSEVLRPWINGKDITDRPRGRWIVDFPDDFSAREAAQYQHVFEWLKKSLGPARTEDDGRRWWRLHRSRPAMREALKGRPRYLCSPRVAKFRLFTWAEPQVLPDTRLVVIARDDDYFFGVLHSWPHEMWAVSKAPRHGVGNDPTYNPEECFETFPFPWAPGREPVGNPLHTAISEAARELNQLRERWLNPPPKADGCPALEEAELKKRTLTNLYNERPTWLAHAHEKLDRAVFAAYGWEYPLEDQEILSRLLAENLRRAAITNTPHVSSNRRSKGETPVRGNRAVLGESS